KLYKRHRVTRVTIIRHEGGTLGFAQAKELQESYLDSRSQMLGVMQVMLAARAAEELFLGTQYNGVYSDFIAATRIAVHYVGVVGMNGSLYSSAAFGDVGADPGVRKSAEKPLREQFIKVKGL